MFVRGEKAPARFASPFLQPPTQGVGIGCVARLEALPAAAEEADVALDLPAGLASVRSVADLRRLIDHVDSRPDADDAVRATLGLSRSLWSGVKRAAQAAVEPDGR